MDIIEIIKTRRSIRTFTSQKVEGELVAEILEAGRWAPSGLNNQPWRFAVICKPALKKEMATLTRYARIVRSAPVLIAVFLDTNESYHRTKDLQAAGACIQNMLLEAHSVGLGAVWLGEIIKSSDAIRDLLKLPAALELMAVVALGHPAGAPLRGKRKPLDKLVLLRV